MIISSNGAILEPYVAECLAFLYLCKTSIERISCKWNFERFGFNGDTITCSVQLAISGFFSLANMLSYINLIFVASWCQQIHNPLSLSRFSHQLQQEVALDMVNWNAIRSLASWATVALLPLPNNYSLVRLY